MGVLVGPRADYPAFGSREFFSVARLQLRFTETNHDKIFCEVTLEVTRGC
ncbi:MAG: hypothetical protein ACPG4T_08870 [Nannocystaceae bacterium]